MIGIFSVLVVVRLINGVDANGTWGNIKESVKKAWSWLCRRQEKKTQMRAHRVRQDDEQGKTQTLNTSGEQDQEETAGRHGSHWLHRQDGGRANRTLRTQTEDYQNKTGSTLNFTDTDYGIADKWGNTAQQNNQNLTHNTESYQNIGNSKCWAKMTQNCDTDADFQIQKLKYVILFVITLGQWVWDITTVSKEGTRMHHNQRSFTCWPRTKVSALGPSQV